MALKTCLTWYGLAWLSKVINTDFLQIYEPHIGWLVAHLRKQLQNTTHRIVSLLISKINSIDESPTS